MLAVYCDSDELQALKKSRNLTGTAAMDFEKFCCSKVTIELVQKYAMLSKEHVRNPSTICYFGLYRKNINPV